MSLDNEDMDTIRTYTKHMNDLELRIVELERLVEQLYSFIGGM